MNKHVLRVLVPGFFAATALALTVSVAAQTPPPAPAPATTSTHASPMTGHHMASAAGAKHTADMKAECQAMMAKRQAMQDKLKAMDIELDKLVAEMNAARDSKAPDALEKPMAAVLNELVVQRKAFLSMMMDMQPVMMTHMMHHMPMHSTKGAMQCPMMKAGPASDPMAGEAQPKK